MTFTGMSMDLQRLNACAFAVTAPAPVLPIAQALVVEMGGEPVVVAEQDRGTYHAALAHASNHLNTITGQLRRCWPGSASSSPTTYCARSCMPPWTMRWPPGRGR